MKWIQIIKKTRCFFASQTFVNLDFETLFAFKAFAKSFKMITKDHLFRFKNLELIGPLFLTSSI